MKILFSIILSMTTLLANYIAPMNVAGSTYVDSQRALTLYNQGVKFIDVRPARFLSQGKIKNAIHLYVGDFTKARLLSLAKKSEGIVIYCNGQGCSLTPEAIIEVVKYGYTKVYYYRDGYPAWKHYKLPID